MTTKPSSSRRKFLAALGAGGAAAAAAVITQPSGEPDPQSAKTVASRGKGYQLTAHVQNYYRTAKV
jgi:alkylation response protein AidB-like acyl-CoA dehydrogenase